MTGERGHLVAGIRRFDRLASAIEALVVEMSARLVAAEEGVTSVDRTVRAADDLPERLSEQLERRLDELAGELRGAVETFCAGALEAIGQARPSVVERAASTLEVVVLP